MGKVIGILFFVLAFWTSIEIYNNGTAGAFGGVFAHVGMVEEPPDGSEPAAMGQHAGRAVTDAHAEADARRERLLAE